MMCFPQYKKFRTEFQYKSWAALNLYVFNCIKFKFILRQGLTAPSEFPLNSWAQMILPAILCFWHYRNSSLSQA